MKDRTDFASKMSTISSNWNIGKQLIKFQNSMSLFPCMSLKSVGETYCPEQAQKLDCDHSKINLDNWESERIRQNLDQYAINDVVVLGNALINYDEMIFQRYGFPILHQNNIMSNSSLALKVFLACYYKPLETAIYTIPEEYLDACKQAYHGGSVQLFFRGYRNHTKIFAIDINSSYPAQMLKQFPIGPYRDVEMCNVKYTGQQI